MSKQNFSTFLEEDARLTILRALHEQTNNTLHDNLIRATLDSFGHTHSREWVRTQLRKLEEIGAVTLTEAGTVLIATLTRAGLDHLERRSVLEGVKRPSPGE